jgi:glycosyltransferase involved in cell wall biosynthesis
MRPELSLVVPAFDEAERIGPTLVAYDDHLAGLGVPYEVVVVDDGSTDGTLDRVRALGRGIGCMRTPVNRGKGHAVRVGMLAARGAVRVLVDADGATRPDQLPRLLAALVDADVAIGSRYVPGASVDKKQPLHRRVWSRLSNVVVQAMLLPGIADTQCGFKAFTAEAATALFSRATIDGWSFDLEVLALARRRGLRVVEVGVHWSDDPRSRMDPLRDAWRNVVELARIRVRLWRRGPELITG